jgi:DNA-binding CsgD family transcriptional regulator
VVPPPPPGAADADEVARVTGGNPFLVAETLAAGGVLPASVRDATLARVARLDADARELVDVAAVAGQRVRPGLLAELAPGADAAVEEALARGVMTDDGDTLGFRHELTRQAIERSLTTMRRRALHARVAEALVSTGDLDHARIAHHAERAGLADMAAHHAALAASEAERIGALLAAGLQLERALRLGDDTNRVDLLIRYARAMNFAGRRLEDARTAAEEAVELADAAGDRRAGGRARAVLSATLWSLDRLDAARHAAADAVSALADSGDKAELARAHAALLRIEATTFSPAEAVARGPQTLAAAADAGLEEARIDALISLGLAHGHRGDAAAPRLLEDARRQALDNGAAIQVIRAHVNTVAVAGELRDGELADRVATEAFERFEEFETTIPRQALSVLHARTLLDRGRYDEALARVADGRADWHGERVIGEGIEALIRGRRGEGDPRPHVRTALAEIEPLPPGVRHLFLRAALVELAWLADDFGDGCRQARAALTAPFAFELTRSAGDTLLWAARCGERLEPPPDAPALPEPVRLELAGDWRGATRAWQALGAPYEAALAALPGDEHAARNAVATLQRLGAAGAARAFARERAARGATSLRGPRRSTLAHPAGLTRREQEVLGAVAGGATNPQVAAALHLSERTVAHHVSAILAKLGAPTRTAAVEAAHKAGLLDGKDGPPASPT